MSSDTEITRSVTSLRAFFDAQTTREYSFRADALKRLEDEIHLRENDILQALQADLGKSPCEGYMTEVGMVLSEIGYLRKRLKSLMKPRRVRTPLSLFPAKSVIYQEPYGVALIMSPWNYPFQLSVLPLAGALAAGCCVLLKPSADAPETTRVLSEMLARLYPADYVTVVQGGRKENQSLLAQRFDYIFFTGGATVGRLVMEAAARHITPVSLELGGKSPCIVDVSADIDLAGKRIAFGKWLNSGQTCVAPDYVLADARVEEALLQSIRRHTEALYTQTPMECAYYPRMVNAKHYARVMGLIQGENVFMGGTGDGTRIAPTVLRGVRPDAPVMREEIFGPVLPVLAVQSLDEAIRFVASRDHPLALYLFARDREAERKVLSRLAFGGGCVNDTVLHLASDRLPFGGVGLSGMGAYHGQKSFETFSHAKPVLHKGLRPDLALRYPPYTESKKNLIQRFMK